MHSSIFLGGPLNRRKTETQLNISEKIIFRDKQHIVHLYEKVESASNNTKVFYHYVGPAEKNQDGQWTPINH